MPTASTLMLRPDRIATTIARSLGASPAQASTPFATSANRRSPIVSVTPADRSRSRLSRTYKDARKPRFGHVATLANPEARPPAITGRAIA